MCTSKPRPSSNMWREIQLSWEVHSLPTDPCCDEPQNPRALYIFSATSLPPGIHLFPEASKERLVALRQIAGFHRPIVHFRIDIDGVFAVLSRLHFIVPNTLEIRGQRPRRLDAMVRYLQKRSISYQAQVCFFELCQTLVSGKFFQLLVPGKVMRDFHSFR